MIQKIKILLLACIAFQQTTQAKNEEEIGKEILLTLKNGATVDVTKLKDKEEWL